MLAGIHTHMTSFEVLAHRAFPCACISHDGVLRSQCRAWSSWLLLAGFGCKHACTRTPIACTSSTFCPIRIRHVLHTCMHCKVHAMCKGYRVPYESHGMHALQKETFFYLSNVRTHAHGTYFHFKCIRRAHCKYARKSPANA
jgi:hypothetical protein